MKKTLSWFFGFLLLFVLVFAFKPTEATQNPLDALVEAGYEVVEVNANYVEMQKLFVLRAFVENEETTLFDFSGINISQHKEATTPNRDVPIGQSFVAGNASITTHINRTLPTIVQSKLDLDAKEINKYLGYLDKDAVTVQTLSSYTCASTYRQCEVMYFDALTNYRLEVDVLKTKIPEGTVKVLSGFYQVVRLYK